MATITVKRGRAKPLWFGHPWLFSEAIERVDGTPENGDDVSIYDHDKRFIGRGFFSPSSQIRVRVSAITSLKSMWAVSAAVSGAPMWT